MTAPDPNVLIVEDEAHLRRFLSWTLNNDGYRTTEAATGEEALREFSKGDIDLVLLDLGLPDIDGADVAVRLRRIHSDVPIIVASAHDQLEAMIEAIDNGANDYTTKPFSAKELLARVRVAFRLAARGMMGGERSTFTVGNLRVDLGRRQIWLGDQEIHLTPTEYAILKTLIRHADRVVTHRILLREIWGQGGLKELRSLRVYMQRLRSKVEQEPARPRHLISVSGVGYRLRLRAVNQHETHPKPTIS